MDVHTRFLSFGAVLIEEGKATDVSFVETNKETLAVEFGLTQFHQYIFEHSVNVESDHTPLLVKLENF